MAGKYRIGSHEFDSREDWENALKDLKRIESVVNRVDLDNPEHVLVLYNLIREGKLTFSSELGVAFFCDISDRVAQYSQDTVMTEKPKSRQSFWYKVVGITCMVLALICFLFYTYSEYRENKSTRELEQLQDQKNISQAVNWYIERLKAKDAQLQESEVPADMPEVEENTETKEDLQPQIIQEYEGLYKQYPNLIGWLNIENTQIDLPVMQTTDNDYYLDKSIRGEEDINGTLFLDYRDDVLRPSTNFIVYGHNMKSGAMFGGLKQYLDEAYAKAHAQIRFDTIYGKQTYQLIAVCLSEVGYRDDEMNRYYDFIEAEDAEDVQAFLESIRGCAVYDKTQDVTESDSFLTLSTCNSYVEDGRLFLVAKKIQ